MIRDRAAWASGERQWARRRLTASATARGAGRPSPAIRSAAQRAVGVIPAAAAVLRTRPAASARSAKAVSARWACSQATARSASAGVWTGQARKSPRWNAQTSGSGAAAALTGAGGTGGGVPK